MISETKVSNATIMQIEETVDISGQPEKVLDTNMFSALRLQSSVTFETFNQFIAT